MLTIASIAAVSGLTALGVAVLPWSQPELEQTRGALRAVPVALGRIGASTSLEGDVLALR